VRLPFEKGIMHSDPPPPLTLVDIEGMRRRGEFRFSNRLQVWIDVEDKKISGCGYSGAGLVLGLTPVTAGPIRVLLPTKPNPVIRHAPLIIGDEATFVQTAGSRPEFSIVRPSLHWPFIRTRPFTIWTTVELKVRSDGSARQRLIGASPFPRHWLYDSNGRLVEKASLTRFQLWMQSVFGSHTPWGGYDEAPEVSQPESQLERSLSERVMQGGAQPSIRKLLVGELLIRQSEEATTIAVILDGNFEVLVDGVVVGHVGPGAVVGERASLEGGHRTADVRAVTEGRVAEVPADALEPEVLAELALGHRREGKQ